MAAKDFRSILTALKEQGWRIESGSNSAHLKAFPPDVEKSMVCFTTTSGDPRAFKNTLRDLRSSGFVWPWPPKETKDDVEEPEELEEEQDVEQEQPEPKSVDQLYTELKEARQYASIAKEALTDAQKAFKEAEQALVGSKEEYERAVEDMNLRKRLFDKAFSEEGI